jgi:hypothetical protein
MNTRREVSDIDFSIDLREGQDFNDRLALRGRDVATVQRPQASGDDNPVGLLR